MNINIYYEEMVNLTILFYESLGILVPDMYKKRAVTSLTMPDFAYCYNDERLLSLTENAIHNHRALATVGDAVCAAYRMINRYKDNSTMSSLTDEKQILQNDQLNIIGEKLLKDKIFAYNNDIKIGNVKDYATAFEAVIGFISLLDINKAFELLDKELV